MQIGKNIKFGIINLSFIAIIIYYQHHDQGSLKVPKGRLQIGPSEKFKQTFLGWEHLGAVVRSVILAPTGVLYSTLLPLSPY